MIKYLFSLLLLLAAFKTSPAQVLKYTSDFDGGTNANHLAEMLASPNVTNMLCYGEFVINITNTPIYWNTISQIRVFKHLALPGNTYELQYFRPGGTNWYAYSHVKADKPGWLITYRPVYPSDGFLLYRVCWTSN